MTIHIGTSGWSYDHWDGVLYPHGTPARHRLGVYATTFASVELNASFYRWPRDRTAAYCVMSGAGLPCVLRVTAPFVYVRLHGAAHDHLYAGSYSDDDLHWWADRLTEWRRSGLDVFASFNNDGDGNAVRNAVTLTSILDAADARVT